MSAITSHSFAWTAPAQSSMTSNSISPKRHSALCTRRLTTSPSFPFLPSVPLDVDDESDWGDSDNDSVCSTSSASLSDCEADDEAIARCPEYPHPSDGYPIILMSPTECANQSSIPIPSTFFDPSSSRGRCLDSKPLQPCPVPPRFCQPAAPNWMSRPTQVTYVPTPRPTALKSSSRPGKLGQKDSALYRFLMRRTRS